MTDLALSAGVGCVVDMVKYDLIRGVLCGKDGLFVDGHVFHGQRIQNAGNVRVKNFIFSRNDGFWTDNNGRTERETFKIDSDTNVLEV